MEPENELEEGIIMMVHLSNGELTQVQRIAAKDEINENDFLFVMQLAGRSCKIPIIARPLFMEVLIRKKDDQFSIVRIKRNLHLQN